MTSVKYWNNKAQKLFSRRIFWLYFTTVILLVVLPINTPRSKLYLNNITVVKIRGDYFFHVLVFIPWSFFLSALKKHPLTWLILGLLFSTGTELLQYLLPYRRFNINDLISNSLGILIGMVILLLLTQGWKQQQLKN